MPFLASKIRFVEIQKTLAKTIAFNSKAYERNEPLSLKIKVENLIMLLVSVSKILQPIDVVPKAFQSKVSV